MKSMMQQNRDRQSFIAISIIAALVVIASCAYNPVKDAQTPEQKAYALYGEFVVFEEAGAKLMQSTDVPVNVKAVIRDADSKAKPLADKLLDASLEVLKVRAAVKAGADTPARLQIVEDNLAQWYASAAPRITDLVHAVKGD